MRRLVPWLLVLWPGVSWAVDVYVNPPPADPLKLRERVGADIPALSAAGQCVYYADAAAHVLYESCNGGAYHAIASGPTPTLNLIEGAAPALSAAGMCVIYADNATHDVTLSCNGEAYSGVVTQAIGNTIYFRLDATNDPITGTTSWNTGAGTDLAIQEDTIDRASAGAETLLITNSGAGALTCTIDNVVVPGTAMVGTTSLPANATLEVYSPKATWVNGDQFRVVDGVTGGYFAVQEGAAGAAVYSPVFAGRSAGTNGLGLVVAGNIPSANDVAVANVAAVVIQGGEDTAGVLDPLENADLLVVANYGTGYMKVGPTGTVTHQVATDLQGTVANTSANNSGLIDFNDGYTLDTAISTTSPVIETFTSSGAVTSTYYARQQYVNAGYTGSGSVISNYFFTDVAGTAAAWTSDAYGYRAYGNMGYQAFVSGSTTGNNIGMTFNVANGNTNIGLLSSATVAKAHPTVNVGVLGAGRNTSHADQGQFGVYATLEAGASTVPTFADSAALVADNDDQAVDIFSARHDQAEVASISHLGTFNSTIGTITASTPAFNAAQTWNSAGTTFYGITENVTNTASASTSRLMSLQVSAVPRMDVDPTGTVTVLNDYLSYTTPVLTATIYGNTRVSVASAGLPAVVVTSDLLPFIVREHNTTLYGYKCDDAYCDSPTAQVLDTGLVASTDIGACLAPNGTPFFVYKKNSNLWVGKCSDQACTVSTETEVATADNDGLLAGCTPFADGTLGLFYLNSTTGTAEYRLCTDPAGTPCGTLSAAVVLSGAQTTAAGSNNRTGIRTVGDQTPLMVHIAAAGTSLVVTKCATTACAATTVTTYTPGGATIGTSMTLRSGTGFAAVSTLSGTTGYSLYDCTNFACSSATLRTFPAAMNTAVKSLGLGADDLIYSFGVVASTYYGTYFPCTTTTCSAVGTAITVPSGPGYDSSISGTLHAATTTTFTADKWLVAHGVGGGNYFRVYYVPSVLVPYSGTDVCSLTTKCANGYFEGDVMARVADVEQLQLQSLATDPYYPTNGRMWHNSTANQVRVRLNATTRDVLTSEAWTEVAVSIPDEGTGAHATYTVTPTWHATYALDCLDAHGCDITVSEASAFSGQRIHFVSDSSNVNYILYLANQVITPGDADVALGLDDDAGFEYGRTRWRYIYGGNNH